MPFAKVQKNKAYFKRYQTHFRRRREGKTDYCARRKMVIQDKNKYNSPKYRFVVRFTNKDVICQICYSRIDGDHVMAAAYSHELPRYGVKLGLTNYAATYATALLLARRLLRKLKLDARYQGEKEVTGEDSMVKPTRHGPRPFRALLDVGLYRTSTGSRLFAAVKGMCDGGVNVPHSEKRFVGYKGEELNSETLRKYIMGGHVADYMKLLLEKDPAKYDSQFSRYKKAGINADKLEEMYKTAHSRIRSKPEFVPKKKPTPAPKEGEAPKKPEEVKKPKSYGKRKLTLGERKMRVLSKRIKLGHPKPVATQVNDA